jgi:hypothetical protein
VDAIEFNNLGEFRGGFANEIQYNFWSGELLREQMPFYVMYELSPASVGSRLAWRGRMFWQRGDGTYEAIVHGDVASREIRADDAGRRVYALLLPKRDALHVELQPSIPLRLARWIANALTVGACVAVVLLTTRRRTGAYLRALLLFGAGYVLMAGFLAVSAGKYLGHDYPPQGGGDDGLAHDGWGHAMALLAGRGQIGAALEGFEPVYWFTPGTRYVRMVEKLIFGDTNHLFALLLACAPLIVFYLARHLAGRTWGWIVAVGFCLLPVGNLSYVQYLVNGKLGYGEAIGGVMFLAGLVLLLRARPERGGQDGHLAALWFGGVSLAMSMFVRPNFALAEVWVGAAWAFVALRVRDVRAVVALACGLGLALWMPFHNLYYGGEFHLISKAGSTVSVPIGIGDYGAALADLLRGRFGSDAVALIARQITGWLTGIGFVMLEPLRPLAVAVQAVKVLALGVTSWVVWHGARRQLPDDRGLFVVAVASLLAHVPMLFVFVTNPRYAMLAWDLALLVLIAVVARRLRRRPAPRPALSPL